MQSSNPALARLTPQGATNAYGDSGWYQPGATGYQTGTAYRPGEYESAVERTDTMTVESVIVRTVGLLLLVVVSAAVAWTTVPDSLLGVVVLAGSIAALVVGLIVSFGRRTNPLLIGAYAVLEGAVIGLISKVFEAQYGGIVFQAVLATVAIFFVMVILYRFRVIRATPRFTKGLIGALIAAVVVMLANLVLGFFGVQTGLRQAGPLGIIFSIGMIILGALTFIVDFDVVEKGVQARLPKKYAWYAAFGIVLGLIWVYLEVLRLLSYLRGRD